MVMLMQIYNPQEILFMRYSWTIILSCSRLLYHGDRSHKKCFLFIIYLNKDSFGSEHAGLQADDVNTLL